jgi:hypothetical protein
LKQSEKTINGTTYLVKQMDAVSALKLQTRMLRLLGSGFFKLLDDKGLTSEKLAKVLPSLMDRFDDELVNKIILSLFEDNIMIKGPEETLLALDFATHFVGKLNDMWALVAFILKVNFNVGE